MDGETTIRLIANDCLRLFAVHLNNDGEDVWAEEQLTRFKIWAANLGVFAQNHASVDHRLRDSSEIYNLIVQLLGALYADLQGATASLDSHYSANENRAGQGPNKDNAEIDENPAFSPVDNSAVEEDDPVSSTSQDIGEDLYSAEPAPQGDVEDVDRHGGSPSGSGVISDQSFDGSSPSYTFSSMSSSEGSDAESPESAIRKARTEVEEVIGRLNRLSASIRQSGFHHRDLKALDFVDVDKYGNNLTVQFSSIATARVDYAFPHADQWLHQRLAESIARRRNQISYRRKHQRKLARRDSDSMIYLPIVTDPRMPETPQGQIEDYQPLMTSNPAPSAPQGTVLSETSASKLNSKFDPELAQPQAHKTIPSSNASTVASVLSTQAGKLKIPSPPKIFAADVFECPYCNILCDIKEANEKHWKNHVMRDLAPFLCVFQECQTPQNLYRSFQDWISHLRKEHVKLQWHCEVLHGPMTFDDEQSYQTHMQSAHGDTFAGSQLAVLAQMNAVPSDTVFEFCPLCSGIPSDVAELYPDEDPSKAQEALQKHISRHLKSLALLSLSWLDESGSSVASGRTDTDDIRDNGSLSAFSDHAPPEIGDSHSLMESMDELGKINNMVSRDEDWKLHKLDGTILQLDISETNDDTLSKFRVRQEQIYSERLNRRNPLALIQKLINEKTSYLEDLRVVKEIFLGTVHDCLLLDSNDLSFVFRNVNELVGFTEQFLDELALTIRDKDWKEWEAEQSAECVNECRTAIGTVFERNLHEMERVYKVFMKDDNLAKEIIAQWQQVVGINLWLSSCYRAMENRTTAQELRPLLARIAGRFDQYGASLRDIDSALKNTEPDDDALSNALGTCQGIETRLKRPSWLRRTNASLNLPSLAHGWPSAS